MKRTLLLLCSAAALHAADFPELKNTNSAGIGMGPPPMSAQQAAAEMKLPLGFKVSVFASEPDLQNPVELNWDTHGRLWVAENYTMDSDRFSPDFQDRIVILDGYDGSSKFESRKVFTDNLKNLMGVATGYGGVWVMTSPTIQFIPDRNHDGVPDGPAEVVLDGFNATGGNMHTSANGLEFGIDGWLYGRTGHGHVQLLGAPGTPTSERTRIHGSIFRYHPVTKVIEVLSSGTVNPWGQDWDKYGEHFFDTTIVGHFWYEMPGAKFVSSSAEPNLKAYELIDQIADHRFGNRGPATTVIAPAAAGGRGGGRAAGGAPGAAGGRGGGPVPAAGDAATAQAAAPAAAGDPAAAPARGGRGGRGGGAAAPADAGAAVAQGPAAAAGAAPAAAARGGGRGGTGDTPADANTPDGHAVVGMMIYQGDNWPKEYRDRVYMVNLFGHRVDVETLERSGSGFVAKQPEDKNLFQMTDSWFRGMDITYGPDGGVLLSDWTDTGDYHNRTGENRLSGRIYKITYGDPKRSVGSDLSRLTVEQLVALNTHPNEWFPRMARMELTERASDGRGIGNAVQLLRQQFAQQTDVPLKLRSLWTLYSIGGTDQAFLQPLLRSPDEHLRVWGIRLLTDRWPLDALITNDEANAPSRTWVQQRPSRATGGPEVNPPAAIMAEFNRMAAQDPSSLVRLVLTSTLQRIPYNLRPALAAGLVSHKEDALDKNLPLMTWWGLIPVAISDPAALAGVVNNNELVATRKYITRRLAEDIETSPGPINQVIAAALNKPEDFQNDILEGLSQGTRGMAKLAKPAAWDALSRKAAGSSIAGVGDKVRDLDLVFGSTAAIDEARKIALDPAASVTARKGALQALLDTKAADLRQVATQLLAVKSVNAVAATALATVDDPAIGPMLVNAYPQFDAADRPRLIAALASRPASAALLLEAVASGKIAKAQLSASDARQIRSLGDAAVSKRLGEIWGEIRETPEAKKQLAATYKAELNPQVIAAASRSQGRAVFAQTCAACHTLFGEGAKIGPDLTGGERRKNLDSLLAKVTDPSSELPAESRYTIAKLKDGQTVSGIVDNRTATTVTLKSLSGVSTVALSDIASSELSTQSLMPEGIFEALTQQQRRNLVAYLMGDTQVPLP